MAMVSCPKCGFTQPADQYCASCGVDMKAFKPREKPFITRTLTSPIFQVIVVTIVVAGGFIYMRQTRRAELAARVRAIEIARQAEEVEQELYQAQAPRPRATTNASTGSAKSVPAPQPQAANQPQSDSSTSSNFALTRSGQAQRLVNKEAGNDDGASARAGATVAKAGAPSSVQLTFYEVSRTLATSLLQNATQTTAEGPLSFGVVPAIETRLKDQPSRSLDSATQALVVNQPGLIFKGTRDQASGANIGFTIQVNPVGLEEAGAQIQVDVARVLRDAGPAGVEEGNFAPSETFLVPKGSAIVVVGILPHKTPTDSEANLYKTIGVLRPLTSAPFLAGQSEAILVIEAK